MDDYSAAWDVEIISYAPHYRTEVERITRAWLSEYDLPVEPCDQRLFEDPYRYVAPEGAFFLARCCHEIVGICGVMRHSEPDTFEIIKLGVIRLYRGMGIGQRLFQHAMAHARSAGASRIVLYTNSRLVAASFLYRKLGFIEFPQDCPPRYVKANVFLELRTPPSP